MVLTLLTILTKNLIESNNIVLFTASSVKDELLEELKNGIKDILKKPIDFNELDGLVTRFRPAL